jgi:sugar phosphate isomerase/epimerase
MEGLGMDRRSFLGTLTAATLLTRRLGWAAPEHQAERIGVQLYTVRDVLKKDYAGTLAGVAAIGYREVEFAQYFEHAPRFDHPPKEVRAMLDRDRLQATSAHVPYRVLGEGWPQVLEVSHVLGHSYLVNPAIDEALRKQPDGWKRAAETFNRSGEASKKAGIQFAYHNHWMEFQPVGGKLPYDILLEKCDPDLVKMEMDLCWISVAGHDPVEYFHRYPGRFPLVHVKDMKKLPSPGDPMTEATLRPLMTEVGSGVIDWKRIFAHSETAGIKVYIVEHDWPASPFESIETSYKYMKSLRF